MPSTLFDSAGLAIVAYAQVDGATGSSSPPLANSGITTTRLSIGLYQLTLPANLVQSLTKILSFVQVKNSATLIGPTARVAVIDEFDPQVKLVNTLEAASGNLIDADFDILIVRPIIP